MSAGAWLAVALYLTGALDCWRSRTREYGLPGPGYAILAALAALLWPAAAVWDAAAEAFRPRMGKMRKYRVGGAR